MMRIEQYLSLHAHQQPTKVAVVCGDKRLTYAELDAAVTERAAHYADRKHRAVLMRSTQDEQFLIDYLAIHRAGAVAVPLEKDAPDELLHRLEEQMGHKEMPSDIADVLYTTGTTGRSKAVMVSHRAIWANGDNLLQAQGFNADVAFVVCGPLNHIGCLSKFYPVLMTGGTAIIVDSLRDLPAFYAALDYPSQRLATFLVPASIRMLMALSARRLAAYADRMAFIETGAAPLSKGDMQKLSELLPHTHLFNTYASTETGIIATFDFSQGHCEEGCLGHAMPHSKFFITPEGTIACQGDTLMSGYLDDEERTREVLREGTLYTSDLGSTDTEGCLHLTGRQGDTINTGGLKVDPTEVESVALEHPDVADCICVAASHPLMGHVLRLIVACRPGHQLDKQSLARFIASRLERYKVPLYYEQVDHVLRTYNGKLDRKAYAEK
jgi:long-chain acyl-CoA synthetase